MESVYSQIAAVKFASTVMLSLKKMCHSCSAMFEQFFEVTSFCESIVMVMQTLTFSQKSRGRCAGIGIQFAAIEDTSVTATFTRSFRCD